MDISSKKEELVKQLKAIKPFLFNTPEGNKVIIRRLVSHDEKSNKRRIFELMTIPPGQRTGWTNVTTTKTTVLVVSGKGLISGSSSFLSTLSLDTKDWDSGVLMSRIDNQVLTYCYSKEAARIGEIYWIDISNGTNEDLQVLLIRKVESWVPR